MEEVAADGVAHLVFPGRRAGSDDQEIRDLGFSDLRKGGEQGIYRSAYEF